MTYARTFIVTCCADYANISNLRNPIIGNVFFRLNYIEMFGTGIRRILDAYAREFVKPDFEITDNTIKVLLPCAGRSKKVTTDEVKVIELLKNGMVLSSREIASNLGWSKDKAIRVLNNQLVSGSIRRKAAAEERNTQSVEYSWTDRRAGGQYDGVQQRPDHVPADLRDGD